jgi:hypothetical protein
MPTSLAHAHRLSTVRRRGGFNPSKVANFVANWDKDFGIQLRENTVSSDLSGIQWSPGNITVGGDASGYTYVASSTGASTRSLANSVTSQGIVSGDQLRIQAKIKPGTKDWWYFASSGFAQKAWVNSATGAVGTVGGSAVVESVTAASGGGYDASILWPSDAIVVIYCVDADGAVTATATASDVLGTIVLTDMVQPYVASWTSRLYSGFAQYVLAQAVAGSQPLYRSTGILWDGGDDFFTLAPNPLSTHLDTDVFCVHRAVGLGDADGRILSDGGVGTHLYSPGLDGDNRGIYYGTARTTALADGTAWDVLSTSIDALGVASLYQKTTAIISAQTVGTTYDNTSLRVGGRGTSSSWSGEICDIPMYSSQVSANDRAKIVDYLAKLRGI